MAGSIEQAAHRIFHQHTTNCRLHNTVPHFTGVFMWRKVQKLTFPSDEKLVRLTQLLYYNSIHAAHAFCNVSKQNRRERVKNNSNTRQTPAGSLTHRTPHAYLT
ncbi:unnamed protein product, partial [Laminaria digitata]